MKLKENKFVKKYLENEKSIFEGIAVSVVTALAITAILTGSFKELANIEFVKNTSLVKVILLFVAFGIISGILYKTKKSLSKILMFAVVMIYFLLAGYFTSQISFDTVSNNPIAQICFLEKLKNVYFISSFNKLAKAEKCFSSIRNMDYNSRDGEMNIIFSNICF